MSVLVPRDTRFNRVRAGRRTVPRSVAASVTIIRMTIQLPRYARAAAACAAALVCMGTALAQDKPAAKGLTELEQAKRIAVEADKAERAAAPAEAKKEPA